MIIPRTGYRPAPVQPVIGAWVTQIASTISLCKHINSTKSANHTDTMGVELLEGQDAFTAFIKENKFVAVDFFATWCGPCRVISPKFEELSATYTDVKFVKVDVDNSEDVAASCGINAMPTFHFYKDGVKFDEFQGANEAKLEEMLKKLVA